MTQAACVVHAARNETGGRTDWRASEWGRDREPIFNGKPAKRGKSKANK